jgi:4-nitrophenyl phosphatase
MVSCVVFDLDGVVYKGATGIPGVSEEIARLQKKCKVLFLTNNATKSRQDYAAYLAKYGIAAKAGDVMTSSFGVAAYVSEKYGKGRKVYAIGESGLKLELEAEAEARFVDEGAEIVAVGLDREINYCKLDLGLKNLLSGAAFILANTGWRMRRACNPSSCLAAWIKCRGRDSNSRRR